MSFVTETPFSVTEASSTAPMTLCSECDHASGVRRASGFVLVAQCLLILDGRTHALPTKL